MFRLKNNFLWEFMANAKFQNPTEKFDKEFWEKTDHTIKKASELLDRQSPKNIEKEQDGSFFLKSV